MGKKRGYTIEEILLVCHGPGHNDTICMAESKPKTRFASLTPRRADLLRSGDAGENNQMSMWAGDGDE